METKTKTKITLQFTEQQTRSLDDMASELETTKAHVIRVALALLNVAVDEKQKGNQIGIVRDGKVLKEIIGIFGE